MPSCFPPPEGYPPLTPLGGQQSPPALSRQQPQQSLDAAALIASSSDAMLSQMQTQYLYHVASARSTPAPNAGQPGGALMSFPGVGSTSLDGGLPLPLPRPPHTPTPSLVPLPLSLPPLNASATSPPLCLPASASASASTGGLYISMSPSPGQMPTTKRSRLDESDSPLGRQLSSPPSLPAAIAAQQIQQQPSPVMAHSPFPAMPSAVSRASPALVQPAVAVQPPPLSLGDPAASRWAPSLSSQPGRPRTSVSSSEHQT